MTRMLESRGTDKQSLSVQAKMFFEYLVCASGLGSGSRILQDVGQCFYAPFL